MRNHFIRTGSKYHFIVSKPLSTDCTKISRPNLINLVLQRFLKLAGSTYSRPHSNIQLNNFMSSRFIEVVILRNSCSEFYSKNVRQATSLIMDGFRASISEMLRFFEQQLVVLMNRLFFKLLFNTSGYAYYCFTVLAFTIYSII